jgi:predicted amidophosphoribosyltransferase
MSTPPRFPPVLAFFTAAGATHDYIKRWKWGDPFGAFDKQVARLIRESCPEKTSFLRSSMQPDWIVPVPQPFRRRTELHGGSSLRFARILSKALEIPWVALLRTGGRNTHQKQSDLSLQERFESTLKVQINERHAQLWRVPERLPRILLVDDIITSGRTLLSVSDQLQAQGYQIEGFVSLGYRPPRGPSP